MKTVIQLYQGLSSRNCPKWLDTQYSSISLARAEHPDQIYREIQVVNAHPFQLPTYWNHDAINR